MSVLAVVDSTPRLRPYQVQALDEVRGHMRAGRRRVCLIAPCGAGKTVMFSEVIRSAVARGNRCIVIAHRKELVDQAVQKLADTGVEAGVVMGSDSRRDDYLPVQVCSVQTLARRLDRLPPADLIIYDEVHHCLSNTSRDVLAAYPGAFLLGATATPWRTDKLGLGDLFDASVVAATMRELIKLGALVPFEPFAYDAPDLHDVGMVAGEFNQRDLALACNTGVLVANVVREYQQHASGRPALVFPVDIAHSKALVQQFVTAGYRAEHLDCDTPKEERERMIAGLKSGAVTLLSSVGVLTEGFDAPAAEVCILARPTKSLTLFIQMVGRVLRTAPGKARALIHDHAGNLLRHGLPDDERDYSLKPTPQRVRDLHTCPMCRAVYGALSPKGEMPMINGVRAPRTENPGFCPKCGEYIAELNAAREEGEREAKAEVEATERLDRAAILAIRGTLAAVGSERKLTDAQALKVAKATREEKAAEFLRLEAVRTAKGFQKGFSGHQYRSTFGVWPRFKDEELAGVQPAAKPFLPLPPRPETPSTRDEAPSLAPPAYPPRAPHQGGFGF